jgi:hypothetical protein
MQVSAAAGTNEKPLPAHDYRLRGCVGKLQWRVARIAKYKYTKLTIKLSALLRLARDVGRPTAVNEAWLSSIGIVSSDPKSIMRVLHFVDLIGDDGRPTDLWETIHDQTPANRIRFANAVRNAYRELFDSYPDAHRKDDRTLRTFFRGQRLGGEEVQAAARRTFQALVPFGDFETGAESSSTTPMDIPDFVESVKALEAEARRLLEKHEEIRVRATALKPLRERLEGFGLEQNVLLQDSLQAAEAGLFRPAHVLSWGGFIDFLCEYFPVDAVNREYPKWQIESTEDLHRVKEGQLVDAGKKLNLYNQAITNTLHGLLNDRNQLAHGSGYFPELNETLAFLSKLFRVIENLQKRRAAG